MRKLIGASAVLLAVVAVGLWLIFSYVDSVRERDLNSWRGRLDLLADGYAESVDAWVSAQFEGLEETADNASLQLYLSQIDLGVSPENRETEPAQLTYLRNLVLAAAERGSFRANSGPAIGANLSRRADRGLALLDKTVRPVTATPGFPRLDDEGRRILEEVITHGQRRLRGVYVDASGEPMVSFFVPVFSVQGVGRAAAGQAAGVLLGFKSARAELYPLLRTRGSLSDRDEVMLVRRVDGAVEYLTPLRAGARPTARRASLDTPDLAAALAVMHPGTFTMTRDYAGNRVLMTSRQLASAPWLMVLNTDADQTLAESNEHRRFLLAVFILALFLVTAALIAAWRHGSSLRAQRLAEALGSKSRELEAQSRLLQTVTDNISDYILLLDRARRVAFANRALGTALDLSADDLSGKTLSSVLGPDASQRLESRAAAPELESRPLDLEVGGRAGRFQALFEHVEGSVPHESLQLVVLHDVAALEREQLARSRLLRQIVAALMRAVDKHDPYSANHSANTAKVAVAIAEEMGLPASETQALDLAANLANVGKIFTPREILTKAGPLTAEDQEMLRRQIGHSLEVLSSLEFEGPVLETIAQMQERLDGSGYPAGLRAKQISGPARVLAVANSFVALVSPRAYREGVTPREAADSLLDDADLLYDRQVVAALLHIVENHPSELAFRAVNGG